uniref:DB domain-containing protein n=1 Tax=Parastrongyloides trichosuri TaxID=131310 RepID=A0A0N4ZJC1_PARTI
MVCRGQMINDLQNKYQLSVCDNLDIDQFYKYGRCLDLKFHDNFDVPRKYSFIHGEVCCENISDLSSTCQQACRNAFFGISMNPNFKDHQLKMLCNTLNYKGDEHVLRCAKVIKKLK